MKLLTELEIKTQSLRKKRIYYTSSEFEGLSVIDYGTGKRNGDGRYFSYRRHVVVLLFVCVFPLLFRTLLARFGIFGSVFSFLSLLLLLSHLSLSSPCTEMTIRVFQLSATNSASLVTCTLCFSD